MINVAATWMEHSGGTKFYQVFKFTHTETGKSATMTHWGKLNAAMSPFSRPVLGGETKLLDGNGTYTAKINAKLKRGYQTIKEKSTAHQDDSEWFVQTLGAELAYKLEVALFGASRSAATGPTDEPHTSSIETTPDEPDVRPASWGTW